MNDSDFRSRSPAVVAWQSPIGQFEHYAYPPGPAGRDEVHVHGDLQIGWSVDFPGRYRSGRYSIEVPVGAVTVVDAWEPHAAEDPCARRHGATYRMLYVQKAEWDRTVDGLNANPRIGVIVHQRADLRTAFERLHRAAEAEGSTLEQEERWSAVTALLVERSARRGERSRATPDGGRLERARDFIRSHAIRGVSLADAARQADLSPQHFVAGFRARYGMPPHRFQTLMRLDHARRLLARGVPPSEVAAACGLSDQSHLTRHFKRYLGLTPGRYRPAYIIGSPAPFPCRARRAPS